MAVQLKKNKSNVDMQKLLYNLDCHTRKHLNYYLKGLDNCPDCKLRLIK